MFEIQIYSSIMQKSMVGFIQQNRLNLNSLFYLIRDSEVYIVIPSSLVPLVNLIKVMKNLKKMK
jgi:hypothetical protein